MYTGRRDPPNPHIHMDISIYMVFPMCIIKSLYAYVDSMVANVMIPNMTIVIGHGIMAGNMAEA
jgi:hypothetical protein